MVLALLTVSLAVLLAAVLALSAAPALAAPVAVQHARGETVLAEPPKRVVVFDPAALDTLDALGVEVLGVPGANLPDFLAKYRDDRYLKVGTLFEPDYEAVAAAAPDLIIIGGRSAAKYAELAKIAPTIDLTVDSGHFLDRTRANVETLGRLFDKAEPAQALTARLDAARARVKAAAPDAGRVLMIMVAGGKLSAYGAGSRFGWIYGDLGLAPVAAGKEGDTHGDVISFEYILKANPAWLLVLDRDAAIGRAAVAARTVLDNDIVAATQAARTDRIVYLDAARWYVAGGGGRATVEITESLADALEGQAKGGAGK
ncbi:siderophore ABC transporter substrate-binding protein [Xanthobacter sp. V4C-4]